MSPQAFASQIFGLYTGFVYFTPLLGGAIADRLIGQRNAVVIGARLMTAGHLAMAFDAAFLRFVVASAAAMVAYLPQTIRRHLRERKFRTI